jgi:hypothetical protein
VADETPPPLERPATLHLSGGIRVQREAETVRLRWINRVPAQIAILLIAISALLGMVTAWDVIQSGQDSRSRLQTTVDQLQRELNTVSQENECRSRFSIQIQATLGHSASVTDKGLAVILRRDLLDQTALAQALEDASQRLDEAVQSRVQTESACTNQPGDHP